MNLEQKIEYLILTNATITADGGIDYIPLDVVKKQMKDLAEWVYKALDVGSFVDGTGDVEDPFELYKRTALKIGIIKE